MPQETLSIQLLQTAGPGDARRKGKDDFSLLLPLLTASFLLFPSPSFPSHALSALERSVLYWGIKRQHLKLFSEALKGHENTHIASER